MFRVSGFSTVYTVYLQLGHSAPEVKLNGIKHSGASPPLASGIVSGVYDKNTFDNNSGCDHVRFSRTISM